MAGDSIRFHLRLEADGQGAARGLGVAWDAVFAGVQVMEAEVLNVASRESHQSGGN